MEWWKNELIRQFGNLTIGRMDKWIDGRRGERKVGSIK
jgi:hypothetical protein